MIEAFGCGAQTLRFISRVPLRISIQVPNRVLIQVPIRQVVSHKFALEDEIDARSLRMKGSQEALLAFFLYKGRLELFLW